MSQWDYKIDQPMPGPFPFPNLRKGPGIEVASDSGVASVDNWRGEYSCIAFCIINFF